MSVVWASGVTLTVEVAFEAGPLDTYQLDEDGVIILDEDDLPLDIEWTDISEYVRDITIDAGRSSEFTTFSPSTCQIVLDNNARQFDPLYASGPYYGDLDPMKRIRVIAEYASVEYPMFTGYVLGWPSEVDGFVDEFVTVQCVDGSRFLENSPLAQSAYEGAVLSSAPDAYWTLQSDAEDFYDEVSGARLYNATTYGGFRSVAADTPVVSASVGVRPELSDSTGFPDAVTVGIPDATGDTLTLEAWVLPRQAGAATTIVRFKDGDTSTSMSLMANLLTDCWDASFSSTALNRYATSTGGGSVPYVTDRWSHVVVTADTSNMKLYLNGTLVETVATSVGTAFTGDSFTLGTNTVASDGMAHVAFYPTALDADTIAEHYAAALTAFGHPYGERSGGRVGRVLDEIGWPSADRDLSTGDTVHGKYRPERSSALTYLRDVETAENGYLFLDASGKVTLRDRTWQWTQTSSGTFSDDGAGLPYSGITIDANNVDVIRNVVSNTYGPSNAYLKVKDDDSVRYYGPSQETLSTPTLESSQTARALAEYWLRIAKDPSTRVIGLETKPRTNPATMFPVVLALELGDRITVERTPKGLGSQIVQDVVVQGYSHTISRELEWITSLYLSPAPGLATVVPYLIVGDATYGQIGATAGNKIPF